MQQNIFKATMSNGLILGVLFSINFLFSIAENTVFGILSNLLTIAILYYTFQSAKKYRDQSEGGFIRYNKVVLFIVLSYFFAGLISSITKFIYFNFINVEYLSQALNKSLLLLEKSGWELKDEEIKAMNTMMKPATYSLYFSLYNTFFGWIVGLIMAIFIKKDKSLFDQQENI